MKTVILFAIGVFVPAVLCQLGMEGGSMDLMTLSLLAGQGGGGGGGGLDSMLPMMLMSQMGGGGGGMSEMMRTMALMNMMRSNGGGSNAGPTTPPQSSASSFMGGSGSGAAGGGLGALTSLANLGGLTLDPRTQQLQREGLGVDPAVQAILCPQLQCPLHLPCETEQLYTRESNFVCKGCPRCRIESSNILGMLAAMGMSGSGGVAGDGMGGAMGGMGGAMGGMGSGIGGGMGGLGGAMDGLSGGMGGMGAGFDAVNSPSGPHAGGQRGPRVRPPGQRQGNGPSPPPRSPSPGENTLSKEGPPLEAAKPSRSAQAKSA
ncbi:hypothetical protein CHS0354_008006 [Potamilus streckersoni]|uniref:Uncharacterized protein n=1 Tax=Potamilus streckersoni TaxID=2493646 RepID=A0AAE0SC83_9BIVA|nr:hypothetical protein CHS0354_008006 [Potamilus streckersoni]